MNEVCECTLGSDSNVVEVCIYTISAYENDKLDIKTSILKHMAKILGTKIDEKVAEFTQSQDKSQFGEIDQWIAAYGDELHFDSPEASQPAHYRDKQQGRKR